MTNPVARLGIVGEGTLVYNGLWFVCPGCLAMKPEGSGLHMLPVNTAKKSPAWTWDGDMQAPTLEPSILTHYAENEICHSFLRAGVFEFLPDCTHPLAGQSVPMVPLEDWML